ncbi:ornithine carbamoyltransferase [Dethiobacter alkaliphilus]|uniref:ornithine carbamoyltransferase n=1 Tax=Dethiobacter alkaliphilus TaxID=427926 RepID=UPI0022280980|nr:ornithine carbamoyltransferase [Dethiobacter alkaliphilus]MCW3490072.1 ornithine carbamoyltransferase [Dethiobacter alkaliphilus]
MSDLRGRDFLAVNDFFREELAEILDFAIQLKAQHKEGKEQHLLRGKTLGMIFQKASTRTRVSFEVGMYQLGGTALFLSANDLQIGRGEPIKDTARVLSRYLDGIMIRTFDHGEVEQLASFADIPVINGLTDLLHPCQAMADLMTVMERKGSLKKLKLAYVGDGNNVANSLLLACSKLGMNVVVASPKGYECPKDIVAAAQTNAKIGGTTVTLTDNPQEAVKNADVVYTDVWASMGQEDEHISRIRIFKPYQVNDELLKVANDEAMVLHCLPAHRGEEITDSVMEGEQSAVFDQAENRLHVQKAIMAKIM